MAVGRGNPGQPMTRLEPVIAELETARRTAAARFAAEANMPLAAFLRHFRVIMEGPDRASEISFRVEPRE